MAKAITDKIEDGVDAIAGGIEDLLANPPPNLLHQDLCKQNKKLLNYYDDVSETPVDETRHYKTYMARHKASGEYRSIRIVAKKGFPYKDFQDDLEVYKHLYHPSLMHFYEVLEDRKFYYFVSDRVDHPTLYKAIPKLFPNPQDFDEVQVALVVRTILRALEFCHKHKFPHTNLTNYNILVPPNRGLQGLYIVGFGYARLHRQNTVYQEEQKDAELDATTEEPMEDELSSRRRSVGVMKMPPEDLFAAPETRWGELSVFEEPADIWSLGIIAYQLLTRHHPYEDPEVRPQKFANKAWREDYFRNHPFLRNVSAPARDFLKQMLTYKDFERPTATKAFQHEWLKIAGKVSGTHTKDKLLNRLDNLTNFDAQNKLERSARLYMASNLLHKKEKHALDSIFFHLDQDKKEGLTKKALKVAFEKGHGEEQSVKIEQMLETTFDRLDTEKKGVIDYNLFLAAAADDSVLLTKRNLRATFDAIDKSQTGTLTVEDLKAFFNEGQKKKLMSRRDVKRIIKQVDHEDRGEIGFEDFCDLMKRKSY